MADGLSTNVQSRSETLARRALRRAWPPPLMAQFALGNGLILLALALIVPTVIARSVENLSNRIFTRQLERDASILASMVRWRDGRWSFAGDMKLAGQFLAADGRAGFAIIDDHGHVVAGTPEHAAIVGGLRRDMGSDGTEASDSFAYAMKRTVAGQKHADVVVYRDRATHREMWGLITAGVSARLSIVLAMALLLSFFSGLLMLFLAMRAVRRMARDVDRIDPDHLERRLSGSELPVDFRRLVDATNAALDRVEEGYRFQGRFADTIAHELRTPISILRLKCEAFAPSSERDMLLASIDHLNHLLGQLRALAALEGVSPDLAVVDLVETTREIVSDLAYRALSSGHSLEFIAPESAVSARADTQYLTTILGNLVGNAISHTPVGTHIVVGVEPGGVVYVADNGPGMRLDPVLPASRARYLSVAGQATGGSGLGLRIIARSIYLMGGEFTIRTGGPGCDVRIFMPQP